MSSTTIIGSGFVANSFRKYENLKPPIKNFGENMGQTETFEGPLSRLSAISCHKTTIEFQKIRHFRHFLENFGNFFFTSGIFVEN